MAHYPIAPVTPALLAWLASRNDPGTPALLARQIDATTVEVTRADGSALSAHEAAHVRATLAAHRADGGLRMPSKKKLAPVDYLLTGEITRATRSSAGRHHPPGKRPTP